MKFVCPMCEADGNISVENLEYPVTKKMCQRCGSLLFIDPGSSEVDAFKSPFKDSSGLTISSTQTTDRDKSVLSLGSKSQGAKDWLAILVVGIVLAILMAAVLYIFTNPEIIQATLQSVDKLIGSFTRYGKFGL